MDAKHTPGPWTFYTEPQPNGCPIVGSKGLMVAMLAHSIHEPEQHDTALANARLIAAAPDLLDVALMLSACAEQVEEGGTFVDIGLESPLMHAARAAIATATQPEPTP